MRLIDFYPPVEGIDAEKFNTFRLGSFYAKRLKPGEIVGLVDGKERLVLCKARVSEVVFGSLQDMLRDHAHENHTQVGIESDVPAADRLFGVLIKLYGPQIVTLKKKATVIRLERITDDSEKPQSASLP